MTSAAPSTYLPPLEAAHEQEGVAHELEATLHGLVDLALIGTQLHRAVREIAHRISEPGEPTRERMLRVQLGERL